MPPVDFEKLAPPELRDLDNFPMLIAKLTDRFMPLVPLRKSQVRILYDQYKKSSQRIDDDEALKELLVLVLALPQNQMQ